MREAATGNGTGNGSTLIHNGMMQWTQMQQQIMFPELAPKC